MERVALRASLETEQGEVARLTAEAAALREEASRAVAAAAERDEGARLDAEVASLTLTLTRTLTLTLTLTLALTSALSLTLTLTRTRTRTLILTLTPTLSISHTLSHWSRSRLLASPPRLLHCGRRREQVMRHRGSQPLKALRVPRSPRSSEQRLRA